MLLKKINLILMLTFFCDSYSSHKKSAVYDDGISTPLFPYALPTGELGIKFNKLKRTLAKHDKAEKIIDIFARCEPYEKVMLLGCFAYSKTRHIPYGYSDILNKIRRELLPTAKELLGTPDFQKQLKQETDSRTLSKALLDFDLTAFDHVPYPRFDSPSYLSWEEKKPF